jgi:hypothetical protein
MKFVLGLFLDVKTFHTYTKHTLQLKSFYFQLLIQSTSQEKNHVGFVLNNKWADTVVVSVFC